MHFNYFTANQHGRNHCRCSFCWSSHLQKIQWINCTFKQKRHANIQQFCATKKTQWNDDSKMYWLNFKLKLIEILPFPYELIVLRPYVCHHCFQHLRWCNIRSLNIAQRFTCRKRSTWMKTCSNLLILP